MQKKAIILFSGGLDSTTCLAIAQSQGYACYALSFAYGQKHHVEIERAKQIAHSFGVVTHQVFVLPLEQIRGSSLTDGDMVVPDYQDGSAIPNTYVPARNTIFLSFALAWGEVLGAHDIFMGANYLDYSGYPDCRPDYLHAFETMANLATKASVEGQQFKIHAPLLKMHKAEIIREGLRLGIDYSHTVSCYRADRMGRACGKCDSCTYRKKGFEEAKVPDPTIYYGV
ncbi:7-cyano-7-deazaguanine synthase QueC [Aquicella lusitana]|uniref:7-cyano-7-deazaguanine synthase n=1 Tax=Aquicella lusitana TaxID=254246 RepID=A0A370G5D2_9COXI|nr:7-cyano-7-deazaguanine synthase QueC [Aquicella lusitana]RDI38955.1 preQ(0) biosynthesis protein QueC [Aquicella lusitana]VVC74296.1 7-cyano-7-deazaguanine synthase [Aquicella lusitana]